MRDRVCILLQIWVLSFYLSRPALGSADFWGFEINSSVACTIIGWVLYFLTGFEHFGFADVGDQKAVFMRILGVVCGR